MPALVPLVLKDGQSTPANHTFKPKGGAPGVATLVESTGVPIGDRKITVGLSETATKRRKALVRLQMPVVQDIVVNGISKPTSVRAAFVDCTFTFDGTSNSGERADILAFASNFLGSDLAKAMIVDLDDAY